MNDATKLFEIFNKIKLELRIESFPELVNYFENSLQEMIIQKDTAKATLVFMDGISKFSTQKLNKQK